MSTPETDSRDAQRDANIGGSSMREDMASAGREAADEAKRQADSMYRNAQAGAAAVAADASGAIDSAASALEDAGHETLSQAANALSDRMRSFSGYLEDRRLEDLLADARRLAQRNPGMFVAGGMAIGFALSRFLKASANGRSAGQRYS
jgi:hypothetical protein